MTRIELLRVYSTFHLYAFPKVPSLRLMCESLNVYNYFRVMSRRSQHRSSICCISSAHVTFKNIKFITVCLFQNPLIPKPCQGLKKFHKRKIEILSQETLSVQCSHRSTRFFSMTLKSYGLCKVSIQIPVDYHSTQYPVGASSTTCLAKKNLDCIDSHNIPAAALPEWPGYYGKDPYRLR